MLKIDLHIHSIASGHAYGTFYDIVGEAKAKKMEMIAITDHGFVDDEHYQNIHFMMGHRAPKEVEGMRILWGAEANVLNGEGKIDITEKIQNKLDILLLGVHQLVKPNLSFEDATKGTLKALENPNVKVLTHPTQRGVPYDNEKIMEKAIKTDTLLELNIAKLKQVPERGELEDYKMIVDKVKDTGKKLIVNSDAHFLHEIGDDSVLKKYWSALGLEKELIINNYPEELKDFLGIS